MPLNKETIHLSFSFESYNIVLRYSLKQNIQGGRVLVV